MAYEDFSAALGAGGGGGLHGDAAVKLAAGLKELQRVRVAVVTGNVAANADLTLTGVATVDTIAAVIQQDTASKALEPHTGTVTVTAANTIRTTAATTGKNLIVLWYDKA